MNTSVPGYSEMINDQETWLVIKVLMFGVTPFVCMFGIVGNVLSMAVLIKHGLNKCSNIILVALAFSDITYLASFNSLPKILYDSVWNREYVGYSKTTCDVLFVLFTLFTLLDYAFGLMGLTLPMIITAERLVVIFLPLSFDRVITPTRTWLAVVGLAVYWLSIFSYTSFWQVLEFDVDNMTKKSVGIIKRSAFYDDNFNSVFLIQNLFTYSSMVVPPVFTVAGSMIIFVQIKLTSLKRMSMTSTIRSNNQTTKTLLAINAVYCVTSAVISLPMYIPEFVSYSLTDEKPSNINSITYQLFNIVECINCSSNFVVYVVLNKKFRKTLTDLFQCCQLRPNRIKRSKARF
ncbi:neuropeptides capa receptor [Biomphalaria pfeifferi]|uniref:Neuropeptides capa receptor n=1 Tax=Biomphalaria pfeifferi TaxID=112525 RepID=A0AAD8FFV5_BIOPF|nr:neuropeptides capa receptor [Biomphalaria pfeifferi]